MKCEFVPHQNLSLAWPTVKPSIESVLNKCHESWIPEDVYSRIRTQQAFLYVFHVEQRYNGCMVLEVNQDPFLPHKTLNIWILASQDFAAIKPYLENQLIQLAKEAGCSVIKFVGRKGWCKELEGLMTATHVVYERKL